MIDTLPVDGWAVTLVQRVGAWAGCGPVQSLPCSTKCNSQCTNFLLFDAVLYLPLRYRGLTKVKVTNDQKSDSTTALLWTNYLTNFNEFYCWKNGCNELHVCNDGDGQLCLRPVYSDTTQLDVELSWVELCRYKRALRIGVYLQLSNMSQKLHLPVNKCSLVKRYSTTTTTLKTEI